MNRIELAESLLQSPESLKVCVHQVICPNSLFFVTKCTNIVFLIVCYNCYNMLKHVLSSTGSSNQSLSPECWKVTLRVLGCLPPSRSSKTKTEQALSASDVSSRGVGHPPSPYRSPISLSPQQVNIAAVDNRYFYQLTCCFVEQNRSSLQDVKLYIFD